MHSMIHGICFFITNILLPCSDDAVHSYVATMRSMFHDICSDDALNDPWHMHALFPHSAIAIRMQTSLAGKTTIIAGIASYASTSNLTWISMLGMLVCKYLYTWCANMNCARVLMFGMHVCKYLYRWCANVNCGRSLSIHTKQRCATAQYQDAIGTLLHAKYSSAHEQPIMRSLSSLYGCLIRKGQSDVTLSHLPRWRTLSVWQQSFIHLFEVPDSWDQIVCLVVGFPNNPKWLPSIWTTCIPVELPILDGARTVPKPTSHAYLHPVSFPALIFCCIWSVHPELLRL